MSQHGNLPRGVMIEGFDREAVNVTAGNVGDRQDVLIELCTLDGGIRQSSMGFVRLEPVDAELLAVALLRQVAKCKQKGSGA